MNWLQQLVSRPREYSNVSEEIAEHLQEKIDELVSGGMSNPDAEAAARRQFGNALLIEEHSREVWQWAVFDSFLRDLKYAFRQLRRNPGFTCTVLLTLAVAIGANTAVFSMVNALLLRPLPYSQPERLASLMRNYRLPASFDAEDGQNGESWELVRDNVPAVQAAVYSNEPSGVNLQTQTTAHYVQQQRVSAGYFEVLGIYPIVGRTFTAEEDRPHGPKAVILSFETWKSLFFSDRSVVGKSILLKGEPHVVIGVLPANTYTTAPADLWTPLQPVTSGEGEGENYHVVMRLKDGSSWAQANAQLANLHPRSFLRFVKENSTARAWLSARPLQQDLASTARAPVTILMSAVALILLIACANLSDLQSLALRQQRFEVFLLGTLAALALLLSLVGVYGLVSNVVAQRTREIGIRMALGSSVRQAMMEVGTSGIAAVLLGLAGGLVLSAVSVRLIKSELYGVKIYDPLTFTAVLLLLIIAPTAATFLPTRRIAHIDPASTLRAE
jgi:hypothetical protein